MVSNEGCNVTGQISKTSYWRKAQNFKHLCLKGKRGLIHVRRVGNLVYV